MLSIHHTPGRCLMQDKIYYLFTSKNTLYFQTCQLFRHKQYLGRTTFLRSSSMRLRCSLTMRMQRIVQFKTPSHTLLNSFRSPKRLQKLSWANPSILWLLNHLTLSVLYHLYSRQNSCFYGFHFIIDNWNNP